MAEYPLHLVRRRTLADGRTVLIRPIRAEDAPRTREFFDQPVHLFTHIDYDRHMAFVCEAQLGGKPELVGEARYVANAGNRSCEFAVVVADAWRKGGVAGLLMDALIRAAQARSLETMEGLVLRENHDMLRFVRGLGFEAHVDQGAATMMRVVRKL